MSRRIGLSIVILFGLGLFIEGASAQSRPESFSEYERAKLAYQEKDYDTAFEIFHALAEGKGGVSEYQLMLSIMYGRGQGVEKNIDLARSYQLKAAMNGHPVAQVAMGEDLLFGTYGKRAPKKAYEWFEKARLKGHGPANYYFAKYHFAGIYVEKNLKLAWKYMLLAGINGDEKAQAEIGLRFLTGDGIDNTVDLKHDQEKGVQTLIDIANTGNSRALFLLGTIMRKKHWLERQDPDSKEGLKFIEMAAVRGFESAQVFLASRKLRLAKTRDERMRAIQELREIGTSGANQSFAEITLATMGSTADIEWAVELLKRAAKNNNTTAALMLFRLYRHEYKKYTQDFEENNTGLGYEIPPQILEKIYAVIPLDKEKATYWKAEYEELKILDMHR